MPHDADPGRAPADLGREPGDRPRDPAARLRDHAAIERLAEDLVPALTAKLGASGLGELEIREGGWRVRLRLPAEAHATARRPSAPARPGAAGGSSRLVQPAPAAPAGPAAATRPPAVPDRAVSVQAAPQPAPGGHEHAGHRAVAVSPAVGFYRPRTGLTPGAKVRAGDRLGVVDVLGIPHDVVAPIDGLLGAALVEPGDPVEYGQEIVMVERLDLTVAAAGPVRATPDVPAAPPIAAPGGATR